jgi:hypothetical protein
MGIDISLKQKQDFSWTLFCNFTHTLLDRITSVVHTLSPMFKKFHVSIMIELCILLTELHLYRHRDFIDKKWCPLRCLFSFGKRWKSDGAKSGLYGGWSKTMKPRRWISAVIRALVRSCIVVLGKPAACQGKLFEYVPSDFAVFQHSAQNVWWPQ